MESTIKQFYIENFKAIKRGKWFDFNNLSVLTGANSSGKSTLFKGVSFFSSLFKNSDFPEFPLSEISEIGSNMVHLVNNQSEMPMIRLGFSYQSSLFNELVRVYYRIIPYYDQNKAKVVNTEVYIGKNELLQLFASEFVEKVINYKPVLSDFDDPSEITLMVGLSNLKKHLPHLLLEKTNLLFQHLQKEFGDYWMLEAVNQDKIGGTLNRVRFEDELYMDLFNDNYANLYKPDDKLGILTEGDSVADQVYVDLSNKLNYTTLMEGFFKPLFEELSAANRFFYQKQVLHIDFKHEMLARVINLPFLISELPELDEGDGQFILKLTRENKYNPMQKYEFNKVSVTNPLRIFKRCSDRFNYSEVYDLMDEARNMLGKENNVSYYKFGRERKIENFIGTSFSYFEIFRGVKIDKPLNSAAIIYLFDQNKKSYQLADLGRGEAKLIEMVLRIASRLFEKNINTFKKPEKDIIQFIFHIEEPEAFLHPKWQSRLADYFVFLVSNFNIQLIIETHSVYLIQRLQLLVARKQVSPKIINLLYFEKTKNDVKFRDIGIRSDGMLKNEFGEGFYDESAWLSIDLLNAQNPN